LAVVRYTETAPQGTFVLRSVDGAMWEAVRDLVPSLDAAVIGAGGGGANLVIGDAAAYIRQQRVSEGYFRVLGVSPLRGRGFTLDEDRASGPPATVLSHAIWQRYFNGDESIVGRSILLRGEPYTVVGVMPPDFVGTEHADLWTPLRPSTSGEGGGQNYQLITRLKPGATWAQASGELAAAHDAAFRLVPASTTTTRVLFLAPMQQALADGVREPIVMLGWAVGAVLLIACVNLAALLLARGSSRAKEIATRMALGSGRAAVVRQLMVEAFVIAILGGLAGLLVAQFGLRGLQLLGGNTFEEWNRVAVDGRVLLMTLGLSLATAIVFGLVPALQASRLDVRVAMVAGGSRGVAGRATHWPRRLLVVGEVALGAVLLVTAGLLARTFVNLRALDPGFDPDRLVTASVSLQDARYRDAASVNRLFDESLERLRATPGIESAAVSLELPYERLLNSGFRFADDAAAKAETTNASYITPGFLATLKLPLVEGRDVLDTDTAGSAPVVLVNKTFARIYSKDRPVIGRRIRIGGVEREIVGITGDVQQRFSFNVEGVTEGPLVSLPIVFMPAAQTTDAQFRSVHTWFTPVWTVRTRDVANATSALRAAITGADPRLPISLTRSMETLMADATAAQRLLMTLVGALAGAAVLLAAIGIHGLIAHSVAERRREFGIRMALGATPGATVRRVTLDGLLLASAGVALGAVLAVPASSLVQAFLWGVQPLDPTTYLAVGGGLVLIAGLASLVPASRLLRLDPAETLRQ
ncbi:MAG TPA: ADOP family duplicated permease, partial [Vicinamibacterales bacterium]|nr:ADOP family duplicated permease [Vicinamibacterales bacterium]